MAFELRHRELLGHYVDRFGIPNVSDDHSRAWTLRLAEQFAFTFPGDGWGTKKAGPNNPQSTDAVARHLDGRLVAYDVVIAGGGPGASINYSPEELDISTQVFIPVTARDHLGSAPSHQTKLGVSWFCLMAALRSWHSDAIANLDWLRDELRPDVVRIFADVKGGPWVEAAVDANWPDHLDRYREAQAALAARNMRAMVTLFGGPVPVDEGKRVIDRVVGASDLARINSFEICNEWLVNGWQRHSVRELGRHLRAAVASIPVALSSPHLAHNADSNTSPEDMRANMQGLYDGVNASLMTLHLSRDASSRWSDPRSYPSLYPLPMYNSEPRGPGASAGGDVSNPAELGADYRRTIEAGFQLYVLHTRWGVFNGRIDTNRWPQYRERNIWDHANIKAIANTLRAIRAGVALPPTPPPPPNPRRDRLLPGQSLGPGMSLISPNGQHSLQYQPDGNLVVYQSGVGPVWASQTDLTPPGSVQMQHDGNLVAYDRDGVPRWASGTWGKHGAMVQLQDDANLVIYLDGHPIWASR